MDQLLPSCVRVYSPKMYSTIKRVIFLLLIYSSILILFETLPYRNVIYWVIVLQIFQLLCARIARKGEIYEEVYDTENL